MKNFIVWHFISYVIIIGQFFSYRATVRDGIRHDGASKSMIKKLTKGKRNYWWFEAIHEKYGIGILYPINKLLTVLIPGSIVFSLLFIWFSFGKYLCAVLNTVLWICSSVTHIYSSIEENHINFGSRFIILGFTDRGKGSGIRIRSSFLDIILFLGMYLFIYMEWRFLAG